MYNPDELLGQIEGQYIIAFGNLWVFNLTYNPFGKGEFRIFGLPLTEQRSHIFSGQLGSFSYYSRDLSLR